MLCSAARESPLAHSEHAPLYKVHLVQSSNPCFLASANALFNSKGKPTCPLSTSLLQKSATCKTPISIFLDPMSMLCAASRESPLAHSEHPFFKRVQLVTSPCPCFLTPLQCFVQQQGKAHLPTLNMPLLYKVHLVQSSNPCLFGHVESGQVGFPLLLNKAMAGVKKHGLSNCTRWTFYKLHSFEEGMFRVGKWAFP